MSKLENLKIELKDFLSETQTEQEKYTAKWVKGDLLSKTEVLELIADYPAIRLSKEFRATKTTDGRLWWQPDGSIQIKKSKPSREGKLIDEIGYAIFSAIDDIKNPSTGAVTAPKGSKRIMAYEKGS